MAEAEDDCRDPIASPRCFVSVCSASSEDANLEWLAVDSEGGGGGPDAVEKDGMEGMTEERRVEQSNAPCDVALTTMSTTGSCPVQYDAHDHTLTYPGKPPHMVVMPKVFLSPTHGGVKQCRTALRAARGPEEMQAASGLQGDLLGSCECQTDTSLSFRTSDNMGGGSRFVDATSALGVARASIVSLLHPHHGKPTLFMCYVDDELPMEPSPFPLSPSSACPGYHCARIFELQRLAPQGGFSQSWFVDDTVVPSSGLLVATPFDLGFFALHELLGHPMRGSFLSAADIFLAHKTTTLVVSSLATCDNSDDASPFSQCGGVNMDESSGSGLSGAVHTAARGDATFRELHATFGSARSDQLYEDDKPSAAADSAGWQGWGNAVERFPPLRPVLAALQMPTVLSPLCETRKVADETYYRFSSAKAGEWIRRKVLAVQACPAMQEFLGLPYKSFSAGEHAPCSNAGVPLETAFEVVSEYIPDAFIPFAATACCLESSSANLSLATALSSPTGNGGAGRRADTLSAKPKTGCSGTSGIKAPKSASVKRLEKAGKPKGTPTILSMFAKKQPPPP